MARKQPGRRRPAPPQVPAWVLLLLVTALGGLLWFRGRVETPEGLAPPRNRPSTAVREPPPFPETPPEERLPAPPAPAPPAPEHPRPGHLEPPPSGAPRVALVLDDAGYNLPLAKEACATLPTEVTFAVLPHLPASVESANLFHSRGFPVILHAPMEPVPGSRVSVGQGALMVGMTGAEVGLLLDQGLASVPWAEGVNNHMGSRATADADLMDEVMAFLRSKGYYFLDSRTTTASVAYQAAVSAGVPAARKTLFLDDVDDQDAIGKVFAVLIERARREGSGVGIGHLRPNTVAVLSREIPRWRERKVAFVPLKEVAR